MKKKIFVCTVALILVFSVPITVLASDLTPYGYWEAVLNNTFLYYAPVVPNLVSFDETYGFISSVDFFSYSYAQCKELIERSKSVDLSNTYLPSGEKVTCFYQWWLPLNTAAGDVEIENFVFTIAVLNVGTSFQVDGQTVYFNNAYDLLNDSLFALEGYTTPDLDGYAVSFDSSLFTVSEVQSSYDFPDYSDLGDFFGTQYVQISIPAYVLSNCYYLSIRMNCRGSIDTSFSGYGNVNPFVSFCVSPETVEGTTVYDDATAAAINKLGEKLDKMLEPTEDDKAAVSDNDQYQESVLEEYDSLLEEVGQAKPPDPDVFHDNFGNYLDPGLSEYDDKWLLKVFAGLWENRYIIEIISIAFAFATFGFVLYGKK